jgi:2-methylisocitrate lyase-like PEP mutase family enzyme
MTTSLAHIADKRRVFRRLHESGCFVLPNAWDLGSARYLQHLGFQALASTSSGFAWSQAKADNKVSLDRMLNHLRELAMAMDVPVNADFEGGYAVDPDGVAANVSRCVETGIAGLSIEDSTGDPMAPLYPLELATARIKAARAAIDRAGGDVLLVGRAENFIVGRPDLADAIGRLRSYAVAGADCLYAPGLRTREQIRAVVEAVAPRPVNVLIGSASELTVADLEALGVRRISVGGALARMAWAGLMRASRELLQSGRFTAFAEAASGAELNQLFHS